MEEMQMYVKTQAMLTRNCENTGTKLSIIEQWLWMFQEGFTDMSAEPKKREEFFRREGHFRM